MQEGSLVKIRHEVMDSAAARAAVGAAGWSYAPEFSAACKRDGGDARGDRSEKETRIYCGKDGRAYWEYVEGYADVGPAYKGPPLDREYFVLYRAVASLPPAD